MSDKVNLKNVVIYLLIPYSFFITIICLGPVDTAHDLENIINRIPREKLLMFCRNNIKVINIRFRSFLEDRNIQGLETNKNTSWLRFVLNKLNKPQIEINQSTKCPIENDPYWFIRISSKKKFFKEIKNGSIDPTLPILGDAPKSHKGSPLHILLANGTVKEVEKGEPLWKKAYGDDGSLSP